MVLIVFLISIPYTKPVLGEPLEDAVAAYGRGDYATAYRLFNPLAKQGDPAGQNGLGIIYDDGRFGLMYDTGAGVPQDYVLAHMWFTIAVSALEGKERNDAEKIRDLVASQMTPD